jgi:CRISPR-associated protein Cmr6
VSRRDALARADIHGASNPGLVMDRYADLQENDPDLRACSLRNAVSATRNLQALYEQAFARWEQRLGDAKTAVAGTGRGRVLIGSGQTVYETSLRLHGTYGFPFIPGSALKGLASSYAATVWGCSEHGEEQFSLTGSAYRCLFGTQDTQGLIVFHDAWLEPASLPEAMQMDVLTVHYPEYYRGNAAQRHDMESEDPIPVSYVSVQGRFLVAVSPVVNEEVAQPWVQLALDLLLEALAEWGVGAKTSAGYGRLYDGVTWEPPKVLPEEVAVAGLSPTDEHREEEAEGAAAPPPALAVGVYREGQIVRARRIEVTGRRGRGRQTYEILGDTENRGIVAGLENDVEIGQERELRVVSFEPRDRFVRLAPLEEGE